MLNLNVVRLSVQDVFRLFLIIFVRREHDKPKIPFKVEKEV